MDDHIYFLKFGVALLIGILVGFQREYAFRDPEDKRAAGVRTFALMGLIGCSIALISDILASPVPLAGALIAIAGFLAVHHYIEASKTETGLTTEMAVILTVLAGALVYWNHMKLAVALGVTTTVILSAKYQMHTFAKKLTREDVFSSLKFAVIAAIVLPVLPNQSYGIPPLNVFNPFKIWLLVVFISGISYVGFILMKLVGTKKGIGLTGLLGGLASSTALTLSFTQRSRKNGGLAKPLAMAIIVAWTVMFGRVIFEVAVLNRDLLKLIVIPILIPIAAGLAYCLYLYLSRNKNQKSEKVSITNPFELIPAIKFGLIFMVILVISKLAVVYFGTTGVYLSSFFSGLADVDAIALSLAELSKTSDAMDNSTAARAIVIAGLANTLSKGGIVIFAGASALRKEILPAYLLMLGAAAAGFFLI